MHIFKVIRNTYLQKSEPILSIWAFSQIFDGSGDRTCDLMVSIPVLYTTKLYGLIICFNSVLFVLHSNILRAQEDDRSEQKEIFFHDRFDTKIHDTYGDTCFKDTCG